MQRAFEIARHVYVYLGPTTDSARRGINFIHELGQSKITVWETNNIGESRFDEKGNTVIKHTAQLAQAWSDLYEIFHLAFFQRKWVVREIASASRLTTVVDQDRLLGWLFLPIAHVLSTPFEDTYPLWQEYDMPQIAKNPKLWAMSYDKDY